ncbi:MAG: heme exporter protein CcmD [Burkholderiales bacterium]|nr:heme exporter protein CcmD [Burkholderiales bacterium]
MNWAAIFSLDGRAFYIWGSFGAFAIAMILEIILVRMRSKRAQAGIEEEVMADKVKGRAK